MFLDRIVATKREEVEALKRTASISQFAETMDRLPATRGFADALIGRRRRAVGLIAEIKKASPSKGLIRADFDPAAHAAAYEHAGADCISVLTDEPYFQGSNAYLQQVRNVVGVPLLRKDFTIDPIQVYEARAIGADAVLLIAAILDDEALAELSETATTLGLDALIEVHDEAELERALRLKPRLIGINNRNLHTFATDLSTTERLMPGIPETVTVVSESGISRPDDVRRVAKAGAGAVLVGEHFMRQPDLEAAVAHLMGA